MLYAFFDRNGQLDGQAMDRQIEAGIAAGVDGIAILGLASEVAKLSVYERHRMLELTAKTVAGRIPLAVTLAGQTPGEQIAFAAAAQAQGAAWIISQPPLSGNFEEAELIDFFGQIADGVALPLAIQNAPSYMGRGLSNSALARLAQRHQNLSIVKWEGPTVRIPRVIEETEGRLAVFNGRGGLELPDNIRAGCAGMIPASETVDLQVRIYELMKRGTPEAEAQAEQIYAAILPLLVFLMQSIDILLCYGKRLAARRLGFAEVYDRDPCLRPSAVGLSSLDRYSRGLGPF
jgi:2-keto-3-deoxy-L-arabinonate dehydratase